jgi:uncharacterized membrane protein YidH (DUF202 family)
MKQEQIVRDERYYAIENASYHVGYLIMVFGTMILCTVRAVLFQQNNWDFFGLAIISSLAATVYQIRKNVLPYTIKSLILMMALVLVTSAVAGLAVFWIKSTLMK